MGFRGSDQASPGRLVVGVATTPWPDANSVEHAKESQVRHMHLKWSAQAIKQIEIAEYVFRLVHADFPGMFRPLNSTV